jgi:Acetyltransferase (GNAT) family.
MTVNVLKIERVSEIDKLLIDHHANSSSFGKFLNLFLLEGMEAGDVYVALENGKQEGIFIYDSAENAGTCFTFRKDVAIKFMNLKKNMEFYTEIDLNLKGLTEEIYSLKLTHSSPNMNILNQIEIFRGRRIEELLNFMKQAYGKVSERWIKSALNNGEKCFLCRKDNVICGMGWLGSMSQYGRFHSLYVSDNYRQRGIASDLLSARILWSMNRGIKEIISEIPLESPFSKQIEKEKWV